jgi:hypothetical protein
MHHHGMTLRRSLLTYILYCGCLLGVAQQRTVFIIDTLVTDGTEFDVSHRSFMDMPYESGAELVGGNFNRSTYPHYKAEFLLMPGLPIQIPLTNDRGSLHVHVDNSTHLDTIRIQKYELLPSCSWDTTRTSVYWYRMVDTLDQIVRREDSTRPFKKRMCTSYVSEIRLTLNDSTYTVPIQPRLDPVFNVVNTFHGYKPRKCQGLDLDDKGHRRCLRMDGISNTRSWSLFGEVRLF